MIPEKGNINSIITASKRSLRQGNISSSVCQEFCPQGREYLGRYPPGRYNPLGRYTPWAGIPPARYTPQVGTTPGQVHPQVGIPLWTGTHTPQAGTPPGQVHTPGSSAWWEIPATSGWYASYWNAFLLASILRLFVVPVVLNYNRCVQLFRNINCTLKSHLDIN